MVLLVSLDTKTGNVKRWRRGPAGKAQEIGRGMIPRWDLIRRDEEAEIYDMIQGFRADWTPPEDPGPSAPPNVRMAKAA